MAPVSPGRLAAELERLEGVVSDAAAECLAISTEAWVTPTEQDIL